MDIERMIGGLVAGALGGRRKRSRRASRYALSRGGLVNAKTLLAAAGVAWGLYETWRNQRGQAPASTPDAPPAGAEPVLRYLRLAVAAARADGELSEVERARILGEARSAGMEDAARAELDRPRPISEIVRGVTDSDEKRTLYKLAFTIVRADEDVSPSERTWLTQLSIHLGLDSSATEGLEREVGAGIDAAPSD